jgi:hypothetical protein
MAKRIVRSFSASARDIAMLEALVPYHGLTKSALITSLIRKEFWRVFPAGTDEIRTSKGARIKGDRS